jgi:hypothetical protein
MILTIAGGGNLTPRFWLVPGASASGDALCPVSVIESESILKLHQAIPAS